MTQDEFLQMAMRELEGIKREVSPFPPAQWIKVRCSNRACDYRAERTRDNTHPCPYCRREMVEV